TRGNVRNEEDEIVCNELRFAHAVQLDGVSPRKRDRGAARDVGSRRENIGEVRESIITYVEHIARARAGGEIGNLISSRSLPEDKCVVAGAAGKCVVAPATPEHVVARIADQRI